MVSPVSRAASGGGGGAGEGGALLAPRTEIIGSWAVQRRRVLAARAMGVATVTGGGIGGPAGDEKMSEGPRLIVLMLGGASHAELRCAVEAGGGDRVAFGCTEIVTPLEYLRALRETGGEQADAAEQDQVDEPSAVLPADLRTGWFHF